MPGLAHRTTLPKPDDPDIIAAITKDIQLGIPLRFAADRAGIGLRTLYDWLEAGTAALEDAEYCDDPAVLGSHAVFAHAVKLAQGSLVEEALHGWRGDPKGEWQRWPTLLERRFPDEFGRRDRLQVDQRTLSVTLDATQLPPAKLAALGRILQEMGEQPALPPAPPDTDTNPA